MLMLHLNKTDCHVIHISLFISYSCYSYMLYIKKACTHISVVPVLSTGTKIISVPVIFI